MENIEKQLKAFKVTAWIIAIASIMLVFISGTLTYFYYKTYKLEELSYKESQACDIEKNDNAAEEQEDPGIDIFDKDYYQTNLITVDSYEELIKDQSEYLLYFEESDCGFCKQSNIDIDNYMTKGYGLNNAQLPLFFVERKTASFLYEQYEIETTPTLVYVHGESEVIYKGMVEVNGFIENKILEFNHQED